MDVELILKVLLVSGLIFFSFFVILWGVNRLLVNTKKISR